MNCEGKRKVEPAQIAVSLPEIKSISMHAVERFRQRTGSTKDDTEICFELFGLLEKSEEVKLKPVYRVIALLNHNFREARYFRSDGFLLVVEGDCIQTIHNGTANRWIPVGN